MKKFKIKMLGKKPIKTNRPLKLVVNDVIVGPEETPGQLVFSFNEEGYSIDLVVDGQVVEAESASYEERVVELQTP